VIGDKELIAIRGSLSLIRGIAKARDVFRAVSRDASRRPISQRLAAALRYVIAQK